MDGPAPDGRDGAVLPLGRPVTTWVVSPHLLVAQAVTAALASTGADVEAHAWETMVQDARAARGDGTRRVVAICDELDGMEVVDEVARLVALRDVRVVVVTSPPGAVMWGGLVGGGAVEVVRGTASVGELAEVLKRVVAGECLMEPEVGRALRAAWVQALDRRREIVLLMTTLSPQQLRVLELLASGRRVAEVAELLGVAEGTVRSHVKGLRAKLGAKTQLEAVAMLREVSELLDRVVLVPRPRRAPAGPEPASEGTTAEAPPRR